MAWVVDTCLLIDVAEADPLFGVASATLLDAKRPSGLAICPVTYAELALLFDGNATVQDEFLRGLGALWPIEGTLADTLAAHAAWHRYVMAKRAGTIPKRPVADVLIGAFALRFDGLLTRNEADFRPVFPALNIAVP